MLFANLKIEQRLIGVARPSSFRQSVYYYVTDVGLLKINGFKRSRDRGNIYEAVVARDEVFAE